MEREETRRKRDEKKKGKKKVVSIKQLKSKLVRVMHYYIRAKNAYQGDDGKWYVKCVTCGGEVPFKMSQAGHYFAAGTFPGTRFEEWNINPQCSRCNRYFHGNLIEYTLYMQKKYSVMDFTLHKIQAEHGKDYTAEQLTWKIEFYQKKLAEILSKKCLMAEPENIEEPA